MVIRTISDTQELHHHFFGFHDLLITNHDESKILSLEVNNISRPQMLGDKAKVGYILVDEKKFIAISDTTAWNYPQGARQQWIGASDLFIFNDRVTDKWGSHIADTKSNRIIQTNTFPIHILNSQAGEGYYINYSRLQRVGGYGYIGLNDKYIDDDIPMKCGIFVGNIRNNSCRLLISISDIAHFNERRTISTGFPHYVTHLCLNPSNTRIAFLHRYRLPDGGETTRLLTIGTDGSNLRCLAKGFLSHFTWLKDENILIWGQRSSAVANLRESKLYNNRIIILGIKTFKKIASGLLSRSTNAISDKSFLIINDSEGSTIETLDSKILAEDGHPMLNPIYDNWVVNDTYPDKDGLRTLMLYNLKAKSRTDLGRFPMLNLKPDFKEFSIEHAQAGLDKRIKSIYDLEKFAFNKSGLHCDLHPRWSHNGKTVYFDSIHEGTRQIFAIGVDHLIDGSNI